MSSAIDPALYHADPARTRQQSAGPSHHRPSLPYPPPASAPTHARHQSQPVGQGLPPCQQPPMHAHRMLVQGSYAQPPPQPGMMYERRPSYYQDPHMQQHAYPYDDRRESVYYASQPYAAPPPAGYEQGYFDVRFQQHVGVDHNAFNRKRRGNLPKEATNILKEWFNANRQSPYPSEDQKLELCRVTSLSLNQVCFFLFFFHLTSFGTRLETCTTSAIFQLSSTWPSSSQARDWMVTHRNPLNYFSSRTL